jgi:hypothetical protein
MGCGRYGALHDYNLVLGCVLEDKVRIRRRDYAPKPTVARKLTDTRVLQQEIDGELNACLHMTDTLW